jgi:hypothetical protein
LFFIHVLSAGISNVTSSNAPPLLLGTDACFDIGPRSSIDTDVGSGSPCVESSSLS